MDSELKQYLRLAAIILSVMMFASLGLFFESFNGLAWLFATPVVVGSFLWYQNLRERQLKSKKIVQLQPENSKDH